MDGGLFPLVRITLIPWKFPVNAVEEGTQHAPISIEEYIEEQASDA